MTSPSEVFTQAHFTAWEISFLDNVERRRAQSSTAWRAWKAIEKAGIGPAMKMLFFQYACARSAVRERTDGVTKMADQFELAWYAQRTRDDRKGSPREDMFERRNRDAEAKAGDVNWPFHNPTVSTAGDAGNAYPLVVGRIPAEDKASIFTKAGGVRRESDPELIILLVAQKYARKYKVTLGVSRIAALAGYAGGWQPDPHTLHDFFSNREMKLAAEFLVSFWGPKLDNLNNPAQ